MPAAAGLHDSISGRPGKHDIDMHDLDMHDKDMHSTDMRNIERGRIIR